jgi:hypothetical protein
MSESRPTDRGLDPGIRERIGWQLKDYYQACLSEELPPTLLAALKKLKGETEVLADVFRWP